MQANCEQYNDIHPLLIADSTEIITPHKVPFKCKQDAIDLLQLSKGLINLLSSTGAPMVILENIYSERTLAV